MKRKQLTFFTYIIGLSTLHFNQLLLLSERVTRSSNSFLAETFQPTSNIPRGNLSAWCSNKNGYEHKLWFLNSCHCGKGSTYVTVNGKCVADSVITKGCAFSYVNVTNSSIPSFTMNALKKGIPIYHCSSSASPNCSQSATNCSLMSNNSKYDYGDWKIIRGQSGNSYVTFKGSSLHNRIQWTGPSCSERNFAGLLMNTTVQCDVAGKNETYTSCAIFKLEGTFTVEKISKKWEKVTRELQISRFLVGVSDSDHFSSAEKLYIVLKSAHNKWLSAKDDGMTVLNDQTSIGRKEKFEIRFRRRGYVTLKTWKGKYLSAQKNGDLEANRDRARSWERFEMFAYGDGVVALKSTHGKWLSSQPGGQMHFDRDYLDDWEKFYPWRRAGSKLENGCPKSTPAPNAVISVTSKATNSTTKKFRKEATISTDFMHHRTFKVTTVTSASKVINFIPSTRDTEEKDNVQFIVGIAAGALMAVITSVILLVHCRRRYRFRELVLNRTKESNAGDLKASGLNKTETKQTPNWYFSKSEHADQASPSIPEQYVVMGSYGKLPVEHKDEYMTFEHSLSAKSPTCAPVLEQYMIMEPYSKPVVKYTDEYVTFSGSSDLKNYQELQDVRDERATNEDKYQQLQSLSTTMLSGTSLKKSGYENRNFDSDHYEVMEVSNKLAFTGPTVQ